MKLRDPIIREMVDRALREGGTLRRGKHYVLRFAHGPIVTFAATPSDHRAVYNIRARLRRAERAGS